MQATSDWSYTKLVKEYGEDIAILLLEYMDGYGEFDAKTSHWEDRIDTPYDEVYDRLPVSFEATPLSQLKLDSGASGVDIRLWRKIPEST